MLNFLSLGSCKDRNNDNAYKYNKKEMNFPFNNQQWQPSGTIC
jgi:hypothetical protein